jgi:hypothetical protein
VKYPHADGHFFSFCVAGQQLYAVFGSIFLGMSDGKTFDLDSLNTLSRWTPSNVRPVYIFHRFGSKIIHRVAFDLIQLLFFSFLTVYPGIWQSSRCRRVSGR